jgi:phosphoribosylformylglycinamidine synthase
VRATILVRPKPGILDPQGEAVQSSLRQLGFDVEEARVGRVIDLELGGGTANGDAPADTHEQLERMCRQLLANPLIESFEIALEE